MKKQLNEDALEFLQEMDLIQEWTGLKPCRENLAQVNKALRYVNEPEGQLIGVECKTREQWEELGFQVPLSAKIGPALWQLEYVEKKPSFLKGLKWWEHSYYLKVLVVYPRHEVEPI